MKCSIIATGTELIIGQTINRNAPEISKKILKFGFEVHHHLTVSDQANEIYWAIEQSSKCSDLIIITGGLGPTSDDLTRNVVADWCGYDLKWDEDSWQHVCERMQSRGFLVKEIQKQQCYFPYKSIIIKNLRGTANAFYVEAKNKILVVLPGPPNEIESVWNNGISQFLQQLSIEKNLDPVKMKVWDTLGLGESDVAMKVETVLADFYQTNHFESKIESKFEIGYRVHLPYVEVKLIYCQSVETEMKLLVALMENELREITKFRDFENVKNSILKQVKKSKFKKIIIYDQVSQGRFLQHLTQDPFLLEVTLPISYFQNQTKDQFIQNNDEALILELSSCDQQTWSFRINDRDCKIVYPFTASTMLERNRQFALEMCLIEFNQYLTLNVPSI